MIELFIYLMKRHPRPPMRPFDGAGDAVRLDDLPPEPEWLTLSRAIWL
jgi:hypothetical protein